MFDIGLNRLECRDGIGTGGTRDLQLDGRLAAHVAERGIGIEGIGDGRDIAEGEALATCRGQDFGLGNFLGREFIGRRANLGIEITTKRAGWLIGEIGRERGGEIIESQPQLAQLGIIDLDNDLTVAITGKFDAVDTGGQKAVADFAGVPPQGLLGERA